MLGPVHCGVSGGDRDGEVRFSLMSQTTDDFLWGGGYVIDIFYLMGIPVKYIGLTCYQ